jgi:hypothetical protein
VSDYSTIYLIFATPADSWTESMAMARTHEDTQARIDWFHNNGYDFVRVVHPGGRKEKVGGWS